MPGPKKNEFVSYYTMEDNSEEYNDEWRKEIYEKMANVKWDIAADHEPYVAWRASAENVKVIQKKRIEN